MNKYRVRPGQKVDLDHYDPADQGILFAEHRRKLLDVLRAWTLDYDYLWRMHQNVPGKGEIVVFNRSHYEE